MRAIFEVVDGPLSGRRIELLPGQSISFGRTTKSDIAIGGDGYMSGRHFELQNTGETCLARDLGSSNGTFVNGTRIVEQVLNPLDTVAAGSSKFRLHVETVQQDLSKTSTIPAALFFDNTMEASRAPVPPPPPVVTSDNPWQNFGKRELTILKSLYGKGEPVYALLDATKDMLVRAFVEACGEPAVAITETLVQNKPAIGSYLLYLPPTSVKLLDVLVRDGWGKGWGVYCTSNAGMDALATHLRNTVNCYTAQGLPFQLRLYEPTLLRWFLPGLLPHEATALLGPMSKLVTEAAGGKEMVSYSMGPQGWSTDVTKLDV